MSVYSPDYDSLTKLIAKQIPNIEGIEWQVFLNRQPDRPFYNVRLVASFDVSENQPLSFMMEEIARRIGQITCGVHLEVERF